MDLVLDIGNFRLKGAFFEGDQVVDPFSSPPEMETLEGMLASRPIERTLISSVNHPVEMEVKALFEKRGLPFQLLDVANVGVKLKVEEPKAVGQDRIANVYGALYHFPQNDCIVVDLGTAVTFDYVGCDGSYLGGAIYPGMDIGAKALDEYTHLLPLVEPKRPPFPVAKTTESHIQSGLYWGLLGAIERITDEMRASSPNPSEVMVLATGGGIGKISPEEFAQDLSDLVDRIDPSLTLIGLHEILKEKNKDV